MVVEIGRGPMKAVSKHRGIGVMVKVFPGLGCVRIETHHSGADLGIRLLAGV